MLFFSENIKVNDSYKIDLKDRRVYREFVFENALRFITGDVLLIVFWARNILYRFEGLCIVLRKKSLRINNTLLILRSIVARVALELSICYYLNRIFFLSVSDYKRKNNVYGRNKLYYVRNKVNQVSRVEKKTILTDIIWKK